MRDYFRDHLASIGDQFVRNDLSVNMGEIPATVRTNELTVTSQCPCCEISPGSALYVQSLVESELTWVDTGIYNIDITTNGDGTCKLIFSDFY